MKLNVDHFVRHGADRFFAFLKEHGIDWFFIDGQPRKLDGERGARIAAIFGFARAVHVNRVLAGLEEIGGRFERARKRRVDLVTRESPPRTGSRLVLADDVCVSVSQADPLDDIRRWWAGPMVVIETSPENFQVLLVSPRPLSDAEHLCVARFIAERFESDRGAATGARFHRFPGSPNYKGKLGDPFFCRLVALFYGDDEDATFSALEEALNASAGEASVLAMPERRGGRANKQAQLDADSSAKAFGWVLRQLHAGISHDVILQGLLDPQRLRHHDPNDWPRRTLHNALHAMGQLSSRYRSSSCR